LEGTIERENQNTISDAKAVEGEPYRDFSKQVHRQGEIVLIIT
jgi:hypothetical protein